MMIHEKHMQRHGLHKIESSAEENLHLSFSGDKDKSIAGTGILVRPNSRVNFTPVSERISAIKVESNSSAVTCSFYKNMSSIIKTFKPREAAIIGGDFSVKLKSKFSNYPNNNNCKYAKSDININR